MITGVHAVIFTTDAEQDRAFFRDVLELPFVDAGEGWLIFALPPAELAAHPADEDGRHELYLMCDDVHATVAELEAQGVDIARPVSDEGFGLMTAIRLPGGGELGLYEPRHRSYLRGAVGVLYARAARLRAPQRSRPSRVSEGGGTASPPDYLTVKAPAFRRATVFLWQRGHSGLEQGVAFLGGASSNLGIPTSSLPEEGRQGSLPRAVL